MDKKTRPTYMLPPRDQSQIKRYTQAKSKGMEKDISYKWKGKKAGVAVLISNKIDFKTRSIIRDKEGHYIMIKGLIQQEDITVVDIYYTPNIGAPKYVKQILMDTQGGIYRNTVTDGGFKTLLTSVDRSSKQKINSGLKRHTTSNGFN